MLNKVYFALILIVFLAKQSAGHECLCTDKFKELYGITEAVDHIQKSYTKNNKIREVSYPFYWKMTNELGMDFVSSIAKYHTLDMHPLWDPFVKNLTDRMAEPEKKQVVLTPEQIERLQPLAKFYTCMFNTELNCLLGIADHVSLIEERIYMKSQVHDILYDFLMLLADKLHLEPVFRTIKETNIYAICDEFTEKLEAHLKSLDMLDEQKVKACEVASTRRLPDSCLRKNRTGKQQCDQSTAEEIDRYTRTLNKDSIIH